MGNPFCVVLILHRIMLQRVAT